DHRLVECAFRIPGRWKIRALRGKRILRRTFRDVLPPEIRRRGKRGFEPPVGEWFRTELRGLFWDVLDTGGRFLPCVRRDAVETPRGLEPIALARGAWRLTRFFRSIKPHLVHTHSSVPGALGRIAARAAGVPLVVHTVHGFHFHERSRLPSKLYSLATERALATLTDMLLMQNREDLRLVRRWRGVRARLIGNGIDVQRFARFARPHAG